MACPRPDNEGEPLGVHCPCPAGRIGELSYLRGEPVQRSEETWATASSREAPTAPSVVRGVPIIPDVQFRKDDEFAITYLIGNPKKKYWVIPDPDSEVPLKPNAEPGHAAAVVDVCVLAH